MLKKPFICKASEYSLIIYNCLLILKGYEQRLLQKDSVEFKVQLAPFAVITIQTRKWSCRLWDCIQKQIYFVEYVLWNGVTWIDFQVFLKNFNIQTYYTVKDYRYIGFK